jgi:lysophospholipase L1-like esterase
MVINENVRLLLACSFVVLLFANMSTMAQSMNNRAQSSARPAGNAVVATRLVLIGDSTMASRTGYGDALCALYGPGVECWNVARGGRSTKSYRAEGLWDEMASRLALAPTRQTYVLIQFGHNDQPGKPGRSTDLADEFPENLRRYIVETRSMRASPVLLTPLTRRVFKGGVLQNDLRLWAEATLSVAREMNVPVIDLNQLSSAAVSRMGSTEADTLAEEPPPQYEIATDVKSRFDYTHLGEKGAKLFAAMVAQALQRVIPELAHAE